MHDKQKKALNEGCKEVLQSSYDGLSVNDDARCPCCLENVWDGPAVDQSEEEAIGAFGEARAMSVSSEYTSARLMFHPECSGQW